jgi:hypothetical protein
MTDLGGASQAFMVAARRATTLYELSETYLHLLDLLEDPDMDALAVEAELEQISTELAAKAEAIAGLIRWFEGLADMRKDEGRRMTESARSFDSRADWLREYVLRNMRALDVKRLDTGRFTLAIRQNPRRVDILEPMLIPAEFVRKKIIEEADKRAILEHTATTGEIVPGTQVVRTERLDIR